MDNIRSEVIIERSTGISKEELEKMRPSQAEKLLKEAKKN